MNALRTRLLVAVALAGAAGCGGGSGPQGPKGHVIEIDIDDHGLAGLWMANAPNLKGLIARGTLAFSRVDRTKRTEFDVWHPADCIGEVGAPIGLVMIAVLKAACEKTYAKGSNVLLHLGNDDGRRASMIFSWHLPGA